MVASSLAPWPLLDSTWPISPRPTCLGPPIRPQLQPLSLAEAAAPGTGSHSTSATKRRRAHPRLSQSASMATWPPKPQPTKAAKPEGTCFSVQATTAFASSTTAEKVLSPHSPSPSQVASTATWPWGSWAARGAMAHQSQNSGARNITAGACAGSAAAPVAGSMAWKIIGSRLGRRGPGDSLPGRLWPPAPARGSSCRAR